MKKNLLLCCLAALTLFACGTTPISSSSATSSREATSSQWESSSVAPSSSQAEQTSKEQPSSSKGTSEAESSISSSEQPASSETPSSEAPSSSEKSSEAPSSEPSSSESSSAPSSSSEKSPESSTEPSSSEVSSESSEAPSSSSSSSSQSQSSSKEDTSFDPSEYYGGYYSSLVSWTDSEDLISQLHDIISGGTYTPITYAGSTVNWFSNAEAERDLYDHLMIDPVYTGSLVANTTLTQQVKWQREHAFCASLMTGSTTGNAVKMLGRATDFHNLFASDASGNSSRKNKNFGVADKNASGYTVVGDLVTGYSYDDVVFEPGNADKGKLARAIFYMCTMYNEAVVDTANNVTMQPLKVVEENVPYVAGDDCAFAIGHKSELLEWARRDVDLLEYQHNESVYSYAPAVHSDPTKDVAQGNRNPFVDYPELIDYAYGDKVNQPGSLSALTPSYETLHIGGEGVAYYAVKDAKRQYDDDEIFHLSDISVVAVNHDFTSSAFTSFTVTGAVDGQPIPSDTTKITVKTPINDIVYDVTVATDPIVSATYSHQVTGATNSKGTADFAGIAENAGVQNALTLDGLNWNVWWKQGAVSSTSAALGAKFGVNASSPVDSITFETASAFSYKSKTKVSAIYLAGAPSSSQSFTVTFYLDGTQIGQETITYPGDSKTVVTVGAKVATAKAGKVKIAITGANKPIYIKAIAIHAE